MRLSTGNRSVKNMRMLTRESDIKMEELERPYRGAEAMLKKHLHQRLTPELEPNFQHSDTIIHLRACYTISTLLQKDYASPSPLLTFLLPSKARKSKIGIARI